MPSVRPYQGVFAMGPGPVLALLAGIPDGSAVPPAGWVVAIGLILAAVTAYNAVWEKRKGPPNP
jgi:hypothetical protein